MRTLVIGGAASGKSELAESLAVACPLPRFYLATMMPYDHESRRRIHKHQKMREKKGFATLECFTDLASLELSSRGSVLLECLGNLAANELFAPGGARGRAAEAILDGIRHLEPQCAELIVVTNDVFADGCDYLDDTRQYLETLGRVNQAIAGRFDRVVEVVCGIPVLLKGVAV